MPSAAATRESVARMIGRGYGDIDFSALLIETAKDAGLELLISTCIIKDRVFTQEFEDLCGFCKTEDIPLYVTLAKPVGTAREQDTWVCTKKDVDYLKLLENMTLKLITWKKQVFLLMYIFLHLKMVFTKLSI